MSNVLLTRTNKEHSEILAVISTVWSLHGVKERRIVDLSPAKPIQFVEIKDGPFYDH